MIKIYGTTEMKQANNRYGFCNRWAYPSNEVAGSFFRYNETVAYLLLLLGVVVRAFRVVEVTRHRSRSRQQVLVERRECVEKFCEVQHGALRVSGVEYASNAIRHQLISDFLVKRHGCWVAIVSVRWECTQQGL